MSDRPLRLAVVGLGRAFTLMLPTFRADPRVQMVGACDPRAESRAQFERDFGGVTAASLQELLARTDVDAVYVASPHEMHAEHAMLAAAHGKHVLLEKPMAIALDDCDAMIAACDTAKVSLVVGHSHSFDAPYRTARELVRSGRYGTVRMIHALAYTDFLYRPRRPEELDTRRGGGVVFSQAAHQLDILRLLAGGEITRVRAITGQWDAGRPTEGAYTALLWFDNGAFASATYSGYAHFDSDTWCGDIGEMGFAKEPRAYGAARRRLHDLASADEATVKNESTYGGPRYAPPDANAPSPAAHQHFGPMIISCEHADLRPLPNGVTVYADSAVETVSLRSLEIPRREVIDELWSAVRHGVHPHHDGRWARGTLAACLALLESAREGRDAIPR